MSTYAERKEKNNGRVRKVNITNIFKINVNLQITSPKWKNTRT